LTADTLLKEEQPFLPAPARVNLRLSVRSLVVREHTEIPERKTGLSSLSDRDP
jgi:hypothetical protein